MPLVKPGAFFLQFYVNGYLCHKTFFIFIAMNVKLNDTQKVKILNATDVYKIMQQILLRENKIRRNQEHFWVVGLNNANKLLFVELISLGAVNRLQVSPPEVFRMAIYKMAVRVILVHNHPSGEVKPSETDKDFTDRMIKAGILIDIDVIDHLIITEESFLSFDEHGIITTLKNSDTYKLLTKYETEIREMKTEAERKKVATDAVISIAKKMLDDKQSIEVIVKYTGLTKKQIENLQAKLTN